MRTLHTRLRRFDLRRQRCAALALVLSVLLATHLPGVEVNEWHGVANIDLAYHALSYGLLTVAVMRLHALGTRPAGVVRAAALLAVCALIDECTQPWFDRTCSALDLACDLCGIAVASGGVMLWERWRSARAQALRLATS